MISSFFRVSVFVLASCLAFVFAADAVRAENTWIGKTVISYGDVGAYSSLGMDASGNLHISYYDQRNGDFKYATNTSDSVLSSWASETVDSFGDVGKYSSLAVDTSGHVHISYYSESDGGSGPSGELRYATNASGAWVVETIDAEGDMVGLHSAIATDSSDNVHISYHAVSYSDDFSTFTRELRYARNLSGTWETDTLDSQESEGGPFILDSNSSIATDMAGNVHISYHTAVRFAENSLWEEELRYATDTSGSWVIQSLKKREGKEPYAYPEPSDSSIAIDSSGNVHISYYESGFGSDFTSSGGKLAYLTNASGAWVDETVDDYGGAGRYSSISLDSSGNAHISYSAGQKGWRVYPQEDLRYAENTSGEWHVETLDRYGNPGAYSSLMLDESDKAHISYYEKDGLNLKYISNSTTVENGYMLTPDLWARAVIHTEDAGDTEAVWKKGGTDVTERGDMVVWGYFYANPDDVEWGSPDNPELFAKIWFDASGRVDVLFFHVSVPDISIFSDYRYDGVVDEEGTATTSRRMVKHYYDQGESFVEVNTEDGISPEGYTQNARPVGYNTINGLRIGAMINIEEWGGTSGMEAVWRLGGTHETARGDTVLWGYFFASPHGVPWGSMNNPDLFVKIWFDASGRIDVNYFHVSVPTIEVYSDYPSDYPSDTGYDLTGTTLMTDRYTRHEFRRE